MKIIQEIEATERNTSTLEKDMETKFKCKNGHRLRPVSKSSEGAIVCDGCLRPAITPTKQNFYFSCD
jgi:hypothetical protein